MPKEGMPLIDLLVLTSGSCPVYCVKVKRFCPERVILKRLIILFSKGKSYPRLRFWRRTKSPFCKNRVDTSGVLRGLSFELTASFVTLRPLENEPLVK